MFDLASSTQPAGGGTLAATPSAPTSTAPRAPRRGGGAAALVALGILLSKIAGLVRQRVFARYLGTSSAADAYTAAWRIPNALQQLLGEGVLSASFIPVYAALEGRDDVASKSAARAVAGAVAGLLMLTTSLFCLVGILATPWLISLIAPGFHGATRELTIELVRVFFPGISLLVVSAFCLGVLNSHREFFLGYAAPVVASAATIVAMIWGGRVTQSAAKLAIWTSWGAVAGALLQLLVQLPRVVRHLGGARAVMGSVGLGRGNRDVREVVRNFLPVVSGRGVVQLSNYVDQMIATALPTGTVAAIGYAQTLYTLPISLFGMSISAAALPSMSAAQDRGQDVARALRAQLERGLRQIAFYVIPSGAAFLCLGDVIVAALFQTGRFGADQVRFVWVILAGSTLGLLATTMGRLYSSAWYALRDTRTPLKCAAVRVVLTAVLGVPCGLYLPRQLGLSPGLGAAGLTASAGVAGWVEFWLLRRGIHRKIGEVRLGGQLLARLWASGLVAAAIGFELSRAVRASPLPRLFRAPLPHAALILAVFGATYLGISMMLGVPEARGVLQRLRRRRSEVGRP